MLAHSRRKGVDYRMGSVMVGGGIIGAGIGALLFRFFRSIGQIDVVIVYKVDRLDLPRSTIENVRSLGHRDRTFNFGRGKDICRVKLEC